MKQVFTALVAGLILSLNAFAQTQTGTVAELVFQNPVLTSPATTAGKDGAVYRFSNVAPGIDATVKIAGRSSSAVVLTHIDTTGIGWNKAFQPQLGVAGNVPCYQNWWMDFELRFYVAGTNTKKELKNFKATAIDVDGDGVSIQEYLQMNKATSVTLSPITKLSQPASTLLSCQDDNSSGNENGSDKRVMGPVTNYGKIDTAATGIMATFTYDNKDMIVFRFGAKSGGAYSNAGERLNSLWFRAFNLNTGASTLPVHFYNFTATVEKKKASLRWEAESDDAQGLFVVERSTDGVRFEAIGQLNAKAARGTYAFADENLPAAANLVYYRIQNREKDGELNYSDTRRIRLNAEAATAIALYPNPVQKTASLTLPFAWQNQTVVLSVYNANGVEVQRKIFATASQTETVDMGQLPRGFYVVKVRCNDQWSEQRLLKN